jgi:hypothetical protein
LFVFAGEVKKELIFSFVIFMFSSNCRRV